MAVVYYNLRLSRFFARTVRRGAWSLKLAACGLTPEYTMDSGRAEAKAFGNGASLQALHLVKVQDPVNSLFI